MYKICRCFVRILGLDDGVATLGKVCAGILLNRLHHTVDLSKILTVSAAHLLILKNQKEAPCQRFPTSHILDKAEVTLALAFAGLILFYFKFAADHGNMFVRVCLAGNALKLQPHGRYF